MKHTPGLVWVGNIQEENLKNFNVVGGFTSAPHATKYYSTGELQGMGMVGIYEMSGAGGCQITRKDPKAAALELTL